jgi:ABC-type multidrug transport system fused ATPase/permease subunit
LSHVAYSVSSREICAVRVKNGLKQPPARRWRTGEGGALAVGYDTVVGERGTQISGGQRQRLALARALIRNPEILVLDEATNALDPVTERAFQDALELFARDRTVIVVAHRLTMVEKASHVVVLDAGAVVEEGDPDTLLKANGIFARMYRLQKLIPPAV